MAIKPKLIQDAYYASLLSDFTGHSTLVSYYIGTTTNLSIDTGGEAETTLGIDQSFAEIIRSIFISLDKFIGLDFVETINPKNAQIELHAVSSFANPEDSDLVGYAIERQNTSGFFAFYLNTGDTDYDQSTITHEIGHTLGLGHPGIGATPSKENPDDPRYTTDDTIMSYNEGINGWSINYTAYDLAALVGLWGAERDSIIFTDDQDILTGVDGRKDAFAFESIPNFIEADIITNFNATERDVVRISRSSFGLSNGATTMKTILNQKGLNTALKSRSNFVYDKSTGSLYFNENSNLAGSGDNGGLFLIFKDTPTLLKTSLTFV
jgi:hypothetical protein